MYVTYRHLILLALVVLVATLTCGISTGYFTSQVLGPCGLQGLLPSESRTHRFPTQTHNDVVPDGSPIRLDHTGRFAVLELRQVEDSVLLLINQEREKAALSQFSPNEQLRQAARQRSQQMIGLGFATHFDPATGQFSIDRLLGQAHFPQPWIGENLYYWEQEPLIRVWCSSNSRLEEELARLVFSAWMESVKGHRKLILEQGPGQAGVGALLSLQTGAYAATLVVTNP